MFPIGMNKGMGNQPVIFFLMNNFTGVELQLIHQFGRFECGI
jgi:hypothetical protein